MDDQTFSPAGEYYLRGVPETASGFKLEENNTFQFFFSYGALDRYGSGTWKAEKDHVIFESKAWTGKDFALVQSKRTEKEGVTISVTDTNEGILRYVLASLEKGRVSNWKPADTKGIVLFEKQPVSSVSLAFEFCPERFSIFTTDKLDHNYFEFRFEPWLFEVFFSDFKLAITGVGLKGKHPLMKDGEFLYEKR